MVVLGSAISGARAGDEPAPREPLCHESLRPQFHFTARYWDEYQLHPPNHHEGWINDLNGLVYNDGVYHLFAQRWWSAWLHAVSADLIHWTELRPAFGKGGKFGGTQSGGGVVDWHNCSGLGDGTEPPMIAFWSSTDNLNQCISYSLDKGRTWTKYDKNPVLVHKYRDPKVFWYEPDRKWIMILYGPSDNVRRVAAYGFNGESNDAHDVRSFTADRWTCSAVRLFDDGKVVVTDTLGSSDGRIDADKQNTAAEAFYVGAKANLSEFLEGDIAEILIYDRTLSDEETSQTLTALQAKWELGDANVETRIQTDGLVLHLDAADVTTDAQGKVSAWQDLSGHRHDVTQAVLDRRPRHIAHTLEGRDVVRFRGGQFLQGPAVLAEGDDTFTLIALWRRTHESGSQVIYEQNAGTRQTGRRACLLTVCREEADNVYLLFSSTNLLNWTKLDSSIPNSFECPDMFELPVDDDLSRTKWVVVDGNGDYVIGRFDGQRFTTEGTKRRGDYGRNFYATMTFQNMPESDPRRVQLAWMRGWDDYPKNMPFNQQVSFPCRLTLRTLPEGIVMCRYPIREIAALHDETFALEGRMLKSGENPLAHLTGELFDIDLEDRHHGIDVFRSRPESAGQHRQVRRGSPSHPFGWLGGSARNPGTDAFTIRVLMDRLSIETYGNRGEVSITNIAYQDGETPGLELGAVGGEAKITSLKVRKLKSIWK